MNSEYSSCVQYLCPVLVSGSLCWRCGCGLCKTVVVAWILSDSRKRGSGGSPGSRERATTASVSVFEGSCSESQYLPCGPSCCQNNDSAALALVTCELPPDALSGVALSCLVPFGAVNAECWCIEANATHVPVLG